MSTLLRISVFTLAAVGLYAQTTTPVAMSLVTSGVAGVSQGQAARLNALSVDPVPPTATAALCVAQLTFLDATGKVLKTASVNIAFGGTGALGLDGDTELKLIADERREIRTTISSTCTLLGTLEIFDKLTGKTQVVVGASHKIAAPTATPTPTPAN